MPDTTEHVRLKLRYLRSAHHYVQLACDIDGFMEQECKQELAELDYLVQRVQDELNRMREAGT